MAVSCSVKLKPKSVVREINYPSGTRLLSPSRTSEPVQLNTDISSKASTLLEYVTVGRKAEFIVKY